jgi:adenylate kinase family enzyme
MPNPYLLVVTGRPGSGKTTFAKTLSNDIYMPLISRDQIKEGYVHTLGKKHSELPQEANKIATEIFFDTLKVLLFNNVSVIAEAAFRHRIWASQLEQFKDKARIYLLICKVEDKVALDRFIKRGLNNTFREYFHGDKSVETTDIYEEPRLDVPTFYIDTSGEYNPSIQELIKTILSN